MNNCNCNSRCEEPKCPNRVPVIDVDEMPESVATLKFNFDGVSTWYDYTNMIRQTQTDTSITADALNRVLTYMAERHTDSISAKELGSILHIADIGDVDTTGVGDNALFVYQKNSDCGQGCTGLNNVWKAHNPLEHIETSADYIMVFDANGKPTTLQKPATPSKHYLLSWAAQDKIKYITPTEFASATGKKALYIDPETMEIGFVN